MIVYSILKVPSNICSYKVTNDSIVVNLIQQFLLDAQSG